MSLYIVIKEEAGQKILDSKDWYGQAADKPDIRFIQQLEITLHTILANPKIYKKVYKDFRQAVLKKFPFAVVYNFDENEIVIYSVFQAKQNPDKKTKKLNKK